MINFNTVKSVSFSQQDSDLLNETAGFNVQKQPLSESFSQQEFDLLEKTLGFNVQKQSLPESFSQQEFDLLEKALGFNVQKQSLPESFGQQKLDLLNETAGFNVHQNVQQTPSKTTFSVLTDDNWKEIKEIFKAYIDMKIPKNKKNKIKYRKCTFTILRFLSDEEFCLSSDKIQVTNLNPQNRSATLSQLNQFRCKIKTFNLTELFTKITKKLPQYCFNMNRIKDLNSKISTYSAKSSLAFQLANNRDQTQIPLQKKKFEILTDDNWKEIKEIFNSCEDTKVGIKKETQYRKCTFTILRFLSDEEFCLSSDKIQVTNLNLQNRSATLSQLRFFRQNIKHDNLQPLFTNITNKLNEYDFDMNRIKEFEMKINTYVNHARSKKSENTNNQKKKRKSEDIVEGSFSKK